MGHTPVKEITELNNVWYADTWSEYQDGESIGDKSLILISDGQIEILRVFQTVSKNLNLEVDMGEVKTHKAAPIVEKASAILATLAFGFLTVSL